MASPHGEPLETLGFILSSLYLVGSGTGSYLIQYLTPVLIRVKLSTLKTDETAVIDVLGKIIKELLSYLHVVDAASGVTQGVNVFQIG